MGALVPVKGKGRRPWPAIKAFLPPDAGKSALGCLTIVSFLIAIGLFLGLNSLSNRFVKLANQPIALPDLPKKLEGFRILHLSDLNAATLGAGHEHLKKALALESYEAVCLTGDMVGKSGKTGPLMTLLDIIRGKAPVFLIAGAGDPYPLLSTPRGRRGAGPLGPGGPGQGTIYLDRPQMLEVEGSGLVLPGGHV